MNNLISRQDAIEELRDVIVKDVQSGDELTDGYNDGIDMAITVISKLPSSQPERKKGRWILHENQRQEDVDNGNYLYVCSECGKSDIHAKTQEVPFCWWCGSEMREEHYD